MLDKAAREVLAGVGDASKGEWSEWTGVFHLRRRLSDDEDRAIGAAVDIRGTPEALLRWRAVSDAVPGVIPAAGLSRGVVLDGV